MKLEGGCLCGACRFEVGEVLEAGYCHCSRCRRASGAPVIAWMDVPRDQLKMSGSIARFRSSSQSNRGFCSQCGSQLFFEPDDQREPISVSLCCLDDAEAVKPESHIYHADKLSWLTIDDDLRRAEGADLPPLDER